MERKRKIGTRRCRSWLGNIARRISSIFFLFFFFLLFSSPFFLLEAFWEFKKRDNERKENVVHEAGKFVTGERDVLRDAIFSIWFFVRNFSRTHCELLATIKSRSHRAGFTFSTPSAVTGKLDAPSSFPSYLTYRHSHVRVSRLRKPCRAYAGSLLSTKKK